jgi:hypothetical protein
MARPLLALRLRGRGPAEPVTFNRDELTIRASAAAAPGTPLVGELEVPGVALLPFVVKVRRCRLEPEGTFRIDGRLVSPTRALREVLARDVGVSGEGLAAVAEAPDEAPSDVAGRAPGERGEP